MAEYVSRLDPRAQALRSHQPELPLGQEDKDIHVAVHDRCTDNTGQEGKESHELVQDETEESLDTLIEDLEAEDGKERDPEVLTIPVAPGEERPVPPELLKTDPARGLSDVEVILARKKYGLNRLKEEKRNHVLKFLGFFVGPVQFVMEVCQLPWILHGRDIETNPFFACVGCGSARCWSAGLDRLRNHLWSAPPECHGWILPGVPCWQHC